MPSKMIHKTILMTELLFMMKCSRKFPIQFTKSKPLYIKKDTGYRMSDCQVGPPQAVETQQILISIISQLKTVFELS